MLLPRAAVSEHAQTLAQTVRGIVRHGCGLVLAALLLGCGGGCTAPPNTQGPTWLQCVRAGATLDPNVVVVETALLERPLGDSYLSRELWQDTDELIVDLEQRDTLRQNGLRVGQLVGTPPVGFQTLLLSPRCCANPERLIVPAGKTITQFLGPTLPHCAFEMLLEAGKSELEGDQVHFGFEIIPILTGDGRTKLTFTPKVETGENLLPFQASPEDSAWVLKIERPSRRYPELSWEATLAPGEYLVIGCLPDKTGSFGQSALVQEDGPRPVQRLFVVRTNRASGANDLLGVDEPPRNGKSLPLAMQAAQPAYPGRR